jgi:hypothetical protein
VNSILPVALVNVEAMFGGDDNGGNGGDGGVGPPRATLEQLAGLYLSNQEAEPLLKLVAAARKDDPENVSLDYWEAEGKMLLKDYSGAADRLKAALAKADGVAQKKALSTKLRTPASRARRRRKATPRHLTKTTLSRTWAMHWSRTAMSRG